MHAPQTPYGSMPSHNPYGAAQDTPRASGRVVIEIPMWWPFRAVLIAGAAGLFGTAVALRNTSGPEFAQALGAAVVLFVLTRAMQRYVVIDLGSGQWRFAVIHPWLSALSSARFTREWRVLLNIKTTVTRTMSGGREVATNSLHKCTVDFQKREGSESVRLLATGFPSLAKEVACLVHVAAGGEAQPEDLATAQSSFGGRNAALGMFGLLTAAGLGAVNVLFLLDHQNLWRFHDGNAGENLWWYVSLTVIAAAVWSAIGSLTNAISGPPALRSSPRTGRLVGAGASAVFALLAVGGLLATRSVRLSDHDTELRAVRARAQSADAEKPSADEVLRRDQPPETPTETFLVSTIPARHCRTQLEAAGYTVQLQEFPPTRSAMEWAAVLHDPRGREFRIWHYNLRRPGHSTRIQNGVILDVVGPDTALRDRILALAISSNDHSISSFRSVLQRVNVRLGAPDAASGLLRGERYAIESVDLRSSESTPTRWVERADAVLLVQAAEATYGAWLPYILHTITH